ncbi:F-box protein At2g17690-like [Telopea speciosissima]|uniref:F-box protein At2g17690-like n=1 Tax=Telopea speciosissima TaxID=54955 RepID=UPI001CC53533|nr:F-box protein At2g17690-like [Telopea speciosissima]
MTRVPPKKAAISGLSQIPEELLVMIMQRLTLPDMIRFGCVCSSWRSVSAPARHGKLPWLMLPYDTREGNGAYGFFSLYNRQFYKLQLPEAAGARIFGSSHGWLVTVHPESGIHLLHPFSRVRLQLPSLSTFPAVLDTFYSNEGDLIYVLRSSKGCRAAYGFKWMRDAYIGKFALSSSPSSSSLDCIVVATYGERRKLAFCRPGDNRWTALKTPWDSYEDIVFHKGRLCALDLQRRLVACDIGYASKVYEIMPPSSISCGSQWEYLMSCAGELIMILRDVKWLSDSDDPGAGRRCSCALSGYDAMDIADGDSDDHYNNANTNNKDSTDNDILLCKTIGFRVYKLDFNSRRWIRVRSLGNTMVFLCESNLFSLPARHFNRNRGDHIYFIDDSCDTYTTEHREGVYELCAFKMVDQTIEPYFRTDNQMNMPAPIWVVP